jgi:hypothetical protein
MNSPLSFNGAIMQLLPRILFLGLGLGSPVIAREEARYDMRELCRSEVSGTLLTANNDVDYIKGLIALSEQKIKDAKARQAMLDGEYAKLRQDLSPAIPAFDLDEKVLALRFELDILREHILEGEKYISENRQLMAKREDFRKKFETLALSIFKTTPPKDTPPGAYSIRLDFKHVCGPYELLCPLPADHSVKLRKIAEQLERPQWCERYSQVLPQP